MRTHHLDQTLIGLPRDYFEKPDLFGRVVSPAPARPPGGDDVSERAARLQHQLVLALRRLEVPPSSAELARLAGCSTSTMSRTLLGERWIGLKVQAVLVGVLATATARRRPA
jgi:hypothetical protein